MECKVKARLKKPNGEDKMRHFPLTVEDGASAFDTLREQVVAKYPKLNDKNFTLQSKDSADGQLDPVTNDEEAKEAIEAAIEAESKLILIITVEGEEPTKEKKSQHKKRLNEAVPKPQQKWTRAYIKQWRNKHIKNAEDDGDEEQSAALDREAAEVPESYQQYLDDFLPKWHKKWAGEVEDGGDDDGENQHEEVPKEYKQWVRMYLGKKHGKKDRPRLKGEKKKDRKERKKKNEKAEGEGGKGEKKKKKQAGKFKELAAKVPKPQQQWARAYIRHWRTENLEDAESGVDDPGQLERDPEQVPDIYQTWVDFMLPRWHRKWGGAAVKPTEADKEHIKAMKEEFKQNVSKDFQNWTKAYLERNYGQKERPEFKTEDA